MLKHRVLTAIALGIPTILAFLFLPNVILSYVILGFLAIAAWEWARMIQMPSAAFSWVYTGIVVLIMLVLHEQQDIFEKIIIQKNIVLIMGLLWWLGALAWITQYPKGLHTNQPRFFLKMAIGFLIFLPAWAGINVLLNIANKLHPVAVLLYALVLVFSADTGAYFAGRKFGKRKLAPNVSPGKTWAGVGGGMTMIALVAVLGSFLLFDLNLHQQILFIVVSVVAGAFSVVGDLTESMFKRHSGFKDSGSILPGHGGMLDRIDAVLCTVPLLALGLNVIF